jgi:hypothetical protein
MSFIRVSSQWIPKKVNYFLATEYQELSSIQCPVYMFLRLTIHEIIINLTMKEIPESHLWCK